MTTTNQLRLSGSHMLYFSYGQVLAYDQNESEPGSHWTDQHVAQGFVRRERALGIGTLIQYGNARIRAFLGQPESLDSYKRAISMPITIESGVLCVEGPEEYPVDRVLHLPIGLYRLTAAQSRTSDTELEIDLYLEPLTEISATSEILKADGSLRITGQLQETGEAAS